MGLRFSALFTGTVLAVSSLAHATQPPKAETIKPVAGPIKSSNTPTKSTGNQSSGTTTPAQISVQGLAQVTGILTYCSTLDRPNAGKYQQLLSNILSGHVSGEIKTYQASSSYLAAMGALGPQLAAVPVSSMTTNCKNLVATR